MKLSLCVFVSLICAIQAQYSPWAVPVDNLEYSYEIPCPEISTEVSLNFRRSLYETTKTLFRKIVAVSDAHFTFSPVTIWQVLAAFAEGSDGETKQELYRLLNLPEDKCERQAYYRLCSALEIPGQDVVIDRKRLFVVESSVDLKQYWENFVKTERLIDVISAPFKSNPSIDTWRQTFNAQLLDLNLKGNSIILESFDYHGLWSSSFSEASIVEEPFYNSDGEEIASLEFMKMRKRVSMAYLPSLKMKILQLPLGKDNTYVMMFGMIMDASFKSALDVNQGSLVFEALSKFKKSQSPIDIAIPRIAMTSEIDVRKISEAIGIRGLWADPYATRNISEPAALPSSYIQRTTVTLENTGLRPTVQEYSNFVPSMPRDSTNSSYTGLDPAIGNEFIANQPFIFGLFDTETYTCIFASSFSNPN